MAAHCEAAKREGVELAVFPEVYVGDYLKGLDFGARIGTRTPEGREDYLRYWRAAIDINGPEVRTMGGYAADMKANLAIGVIECDGATLYRTALFFGPDGALLGKHRKLMPTASERLLWGQGDGLTIPVLETPVGKLGAATCWENHMPMLRQSMYARGIEIWCAPTVDERDIWQASMRHIAYEGRMFMLSAFQYMTRVDAGRRSGLVRATCAPIRTERDDMMMKTLLLASALSGIALPTGATAAANPASVFCGKMGGRTVVATLSGGDQIGLCYLPGQRVVEEWTLFRMLDGKVPARGRNPFAVR